MTQITYLIKMLLCSGLFTGYYWLFLRNKRFHQYNRFFLLAVVVLSLLLPALTLPVWNKPASKPAVVLYNLSAQWRMPGFEPPTSQPEAGMGSNAPQATLAAARRFPVWPVIVGSLYTVVAFLLLYRLGKALVTIQKIKRRYPAQLIDHISFYYTTEPGTPFSFFRQVFWDARLDMESNQGRQILRHELFHVRQWHSADIIFMELLCIAGWFNPFFHLIKKELRAIHEFLADRHAATNEDQFAYATLLVQQIVQNRQHPVTHYFFQNQIKRRIAMITQKSPATYGYWSRLMVLPLLLIVGSVISLKAQQTQKSQPVSSQHKPSKTTTQAAPKAATSTLSVTKRTDGSKPGTATNLIREIRDSGFEKSIAIEKVRTLMRTTFTMQEAEALFGTPQAKVFSSAESKWTYKTLYSDMLLEFDRNNDSIIAYHFRGTMQQFSDKLSYDKVRNIKEKITTPDAIKTDFGKPCIVTLENGEESWLYQTLNANLLVAYDHNAQKQLTVSSFNFIENKLASAAMPTNGK